MRSSSSKKKKHTAAIVVVIVIVAAAVLLAGWLGLGWFGGNPFVLDQKAQDGQLVAGMSAQEIEQALQQQVDKSKLSFSINARPVFETDKSEGNILIINPQDNAYAIEVKVRLNDTGETAYGTDILLPGQYILKDTLETELAKGEYPATATITAYDRETQEETGKTQASVMIVVEG